MSSHAHGHEKIIAGVGAQYREILEASRQSIYIYLDDVNKLCNRNFASLLAYKSPKDWADVKENFPEAFVAKKSRQALISAYQEAVTNSVGSKIDVTWKRKDGKEVRTATIIVPIEYEGHLMALHYIEES